MNQQMKKIRERSKSREDQKMIKEKIKAELKEIRDKLANAERQANETNKKIELYNKRAK